MRSAHHFAISLLAGLACTTVVETALGPAGTVAYAGLVGTLVDPGLVLFRQSDIFPAGALTAAQRLATHLAVGATLTAALVPVAPGLAAVGAAVLTVHVLADIVWDAWQRR
ncbi:MAG: hypothetical protein ABEH56_02675 [Salinirussus sp.]